MKRNILILMTLIWSCAAFASTLKVVAGNHKFLKDKGTIAVVFNWDQAKYADDTKSLKDEWKDEYQKYVEDGENFFVDGFNLKTKTLKAVAASEANDAQYTMTVTITKIDYFFSVMSIVPGHKYTLWADISIKDATGKEVCAVKAERFKGGRDFVRYDAYTEMMNDLGSHLASI